MSSIIGGYFEIELKLGSEYHKDAIRLNTGRNAFEYILKTKQYKKVYLPFYTCDVMLEPIEKTNVNIEFYSIDKSFRPIFDFKKIKTDEVFVYNNYFGICDKQVHEIASKCNNLIIDNSQAFFSPPIPNVDTFYSPRKFFGLPDGGYLYTNKISDYIFEKDTSYNRFEHLLGRIDTNAEQHFRSYKESNKKLQHQPIRKMSNLTQHLLKSIDYEIVASTRIKNYEFLHEFFGESNKLSVALEENAVPMVYPYWIEDGQVLREKLIHNKIFVATYWPNVNEWTSNESLEVNFAKNIVALPIDQRYGTNEMQRIIKTIGYK